ncbi:MAG: hydroxysqualene dehydroxylase HpnE [Reyranellaceae bacterium]
MTVHVIGAGLAGLSAAVAVASRGVPVVLSEAVRQAGGRCRSYHDSQLGMTIDNGNHLVLSGNMAVERYLRDIGAVDRLTGPDRPEFPFMDLDSGERWTLSPDNGPIPWWVLQAGRRVPGTRLRDHLALLSLLRRHPGRRIDEVIRCDTALWQKLLRPVLLSALNTAPEAASANLAGAIVRETFARGGRYMRPLISSPNLAAAFVDPALDRLRQRGVDVRFGRPLRAIEFADGRAVALVFDGEEATVQPDDRVIVAVPPWTAEKLLPGLIAPQAFNAILNAHFQVVPPPGAPPMLGLIGGTAEWVFAFHDRISVTVSAADHLMETDGESLAFLLWCDVSTAYGLAAPAPPRRIVKEKRATFAATPEQDALRPAARTGWTNTFLAGDWTDTGLPATIEGALRSGATAAALALGGA